MNIKPPTIYFAIYTFHAPSYSLGNVSKAKRFNEKAIESIGMKQLGESIAYSVPTQLKAQGDQAYNDEGGVSCISLLSTSGIEIHTWPDITTEGKIKGSDPGLGYVCVQSCRTFDPKKVAYLIKQMYLAKKVRADIFKINLNREFLER